MAKKKPAAALKKRAALGRGLESLIPSAPAPPAADKEDAAFLMCDTGLIRPNPYQPRLLFSDEELAELSASIEEQGILQPLLVRKNTTGYELIAGERRLRASRMAGLKQVPVVVKDISDTEMLEMSIIENIQREALNPLEEAEAYHRLMTEFDMTQEQAAKRVGKSRPAVANMLRLRQLSQPIKDSINDGTLSMGHARAILGVENPTRQKAVWREVVSRGLSVRQTEALAKKQKTGKKPARPPQANSDNIYFRSLAEELSRRFGTRVQIVRQGKKGRVEIDFFSDDDLDRLLSILKPS
jgi:ParB family chromosome partitioning protein